MGRGFEEEEFAAARQAQESSIQKKKRIVARVEQAGIDLCESNKSQVEEKILFGFETPSVLEVEHGLDTSLRDTLDTRMANRFSRRFERKYGQGAVEMFKKMAEDPDNSLSDVGRLFGFSKQYAWYVYQKISGGPYSEVLKRKQLIRKQNCFDSWQKSKDVELLMKLKEKIESLGFACHITKGKRRYVFVVNGYKFVFKFTSTSRMIGAKQYFHFGTPNSTIKAGYDFLVTLCISEDESAYYVIPRDAMPKDGVSLQPQAGLHESKYARFKEAWDLLFTDENAN